MLKVTDFIDSVDRLNYLGHTGSLIWSTTVHIPHEKHVQIKII